MNKYLVSVNMSADVEVEAENAEAAQAIAKEGKKFSNLRIESVGQAKIDKPCGNSDCKGWALFEPMGLNNGNAFQIEKCDACGVFESDMDAELFVINEITEMAKKLIEYNDKPKYNNAGVLLVRVHKELTQALEENLVRIPNYEWIRKNLI